MSHPTCNPTCRACQDAAGHKGAALNAIKAHLRTVYIAYVHGDALDPDERAAIESLLAEAERNVQASGPEVASLEEVH